MHVTHHFILTVIPFISTLLYKGALKSSSLSSSGGAEKWRNIARVRFKTVYLPFGITPGSMKVASVKFASTKKVITPWYAGTHGWSGI